jgi:MFS family permease
MIQTIQRRLLVHPEMFLVLKTECYDKGGRILITAVAGFFVFYLILAVFVNFTVISSPAVIACLPVLVFTRGITGLFYSAIPPVSASVVSDKTSP